MERTFYPEFEQCSDEWFALRCGCVTASEFATVMAKGRGSSPSKTRRTYMLKLIGEKLTGDPTDYYSNFHMERGKELEPEARMLYTLQTGNEVQQIGFVKAGDEIGYSPDGLVGNDGLIEIKTKLPHLQIEVLLADEVPPEHMAQIQGGLWVTEREWLDFVSYWPKLPMFTKRVYRDEKYIANLTAEINRFLSEMHELMEKIQ